MAGTMDGIRVLEVAEHTFVPAASAVLSDWGACEACPADIDCDGLVAVGDVLAVLDAWGPCD